MNQAPAPATGATTLSGLIPPDTLSTGFAAGDTINVNGTTLTFVGTLGLLALACRQQGAAAGKKA